MTFNEYQKKALETAGSTEVIMSALGIGGESGEILDIVKKMLYHNHGPNYEKMLEELGDLLWYIAALAHSYGFTLNQVASFNNKKLKKRYPEGFSHERSKNRKN